MVDGLFRSRREAWLAELADWGTWWGKELAAIFPRAAARWSSAGPVAQLGPGTAIDGGVEGGAPAAAPGLTVRIWRSGATNGQEVLRLPVALQDVSPSQAADLRRACEGCRIHLLLDAQDVHRVMLRVPQAALNEQGLRYALAADAPVQLSHLALDWQVCQPQPAGLQPGWAEVEVVMCRQSLLATKVAALQRCGLVAERIGMTDVPGIDGIAPPLSALAFTFLRQRVGGPAGHQLQLALMASIVLAFLVGPMAAGWHAHFQSLRLRSAAEAAQAQRNSILPMAQRRANTAALHAALRPALTVGPATSLLAELAQRLSDDVWLQEVRLDGVQLRLLGQAAEPQSVVAALSSSSLLGDARLESVNAAAQPGGPVGFSLTAVLRPSAR
jgi:hypothetical protein